MSGQSIFKSAYDEYAKQYLVSQGWRSWIVNKRRWYCDVIGVSGQTVAIVEVKSPAEGSVGKTYDDTKSLSAAILSDLPPGFRQRRQEILDDIAAQANVSLVKLYAVSVACQLFRYAKEYSEKMRHYQKTAPAGPYVLPDTRSCPVEPYFVVPIEANRVLDAALIYLREKSLIESYDTESNCRIFIAKIRYP